MKSERNGLIILVKPRFSLFSRCIMTVPAGKEQLKGTEEKISIYLLLFPFRKHKTNLEV